MTHIEELMTMCFLNHRFEPFLINEDIATKN